MNILELIKNEEVEWKKIGEVCELKRGNVITEKQTKLGEYPVISGGQTPAYYHNEYNREGNIITIAGSGVYAGYIAYWDKPIFVSDAFSIQGIKDILNTKYVYYFLKTKQYKIYNMKTGAGIPHIYISDIEKILIPIPTLQTQEKIVETLDKFTKCVTELKSELKSRVKQYNYYRDKLLSEDYLNKMELGSDVVEYKKLGEIGKISMCRRILKNQTQSIGNIPFYKIGTFGGQADSYITKELFYEYKSKYPYPKKGEILISASGTIGRTAIYNGEDAYFQDSNIVWLSHDESQVMNKYLYYFYNTNPWKVSDGGTISRIYNSDIEKILIPLPPLHLQNKIVQILDKFQEYSTDVEGLLPKEIELRQKQYEFYREKLLTFDKNVVTHTHTI